MSIPRHISVVLLILAISPLASIAREPATAPTSRPASPENPAMLKAISKKDFPEVKKLLDAGASPNTEGDSPLSEASYGGRIEIAKMLLAKGANPDSVNHWGCSALYLAAYSANAPVVQLLLDAGAKDKDRALLRAALLGERDIAQLLLDAGADVNCRGINGISPLWQAAHKGATKTVETLLNAGSDRGLIGYGITPEAEARARGHADVADLIANFKPKPKR